MTKETRTEKNLIMIVMPAFNEAAHIAKVIKDLPSKIVAGKRAFTTQVVVVDDCSKDKTSTEAKKAGATVIRHVMNSGAGAATRTGLKYAEQHADDVAYVVTIDSDGQHSAKDIERIVKFAAQRNAQMVVGNRLHEGNKKDMPLHRSIGNWGLSTISRILFGIKTKDTQSGMRLFSSDILPIVSDYTIDRYGFCTEMLWMAVRSKVNVQEMPISVKYSEETLANGQNNWGAVDLLLDLLWIRISR